MNKCDCGSGKTYGIKPGEIGHSVWCSTMSPSKRRSCGGDVELCFTEATRWVYFLADPTKMHMYCESCFNFWDTQSKHGTYSIESSGKFQ